jgi:transposase-like protein
MRNITAVRHGRHASGTTVGNGKEHTSLTETIPIEQAAGGAHATGNAANNGKGHASLTKTIPIVQVLSPHGAETSTLNGVSRIADPFSAPEAEAPGGESEGESEQVSDSAAPTSPLDWNARLRQHLPALRPEWPVEAERSSERLESKQAMAVGLLVWGMTKTDVARQLDVDRSTVHRWLNDPLFVAELEARRSELIDSMLDRQLLGSRIGTAKLMELVDSPNELVSLRAATALVTSGQRAYESIDVKKRIEHLEDNMGIVYGFKV